MSAARSCEPTSSPPRRARLAFHFVTRNLGEDNTVPARFYARSIVMRSISIMREDLIDGVEVVDSG
ncbi:MAG: hypothetical protein RXN88_04235 [Acidilobus sp.]|jgi:hypothetical protein